MSDQPDESTLMKYLSGACSADEAAGVRAWIAEEPGRAALVERLARAWNPPAVPAFDPDDRLRHRLRAELAPPAGGRAEARPVRFRGLPGGVSPRRAPWIGLLAGLAAAVLVIVGGVVLVRRAEMPSPGQTAAAPMREIVTPRGQRAAFALGDGTRVMLDAESRLRIPASYPSSTGAAGVDRDLYLVGRAHFQVTHDSTSAFRVHTATGVIEDLGTEFVVSAYPDRRETEVVVAEGAVAVHPANAPAGAAPLATLTRGVMAQVSAAGLTRLIDGVDLEEYLAWTTGRHIFKHTRLRDAVAELGRWYDVDIVAADPRLLDRRFTAAFENEPLAHVLDVLSVALDVRIERHGRTLTLIPRNPTPRRGES